jgi:hypothetical protein
MFESELARVRFRDRTRNEVRRLQRRALVLFRVFEPLAVRLSATMPESGARVSPTRARYQLRYFGNDVSDASRILVLESTVGCL